MKIKYQLIILALFATLSTSACRQSQRQLTTYNSLREAHQKHRTTLVRKLKDDAPSLTVPAGQPFKLTTYKGPLGPMRVMHSVLPAQKQKRPAIVWVVGGFPMGGFSADVWRPQPRHNDQSARAYHAAGIVSVFPSFRGMSGNPGFQEGFFGEVDDLMAAVAFARSLPGVDPKRVFIGGHSTGGTLALLAAEVAKKADVRGVIAFGPVHDAFAYGSESLPCKPALDERLARAPGLYLADIRVPTLIVEGTDGNIDDLRVMRDGALGSQSDIATFMEVRGGTHFDILAPLNDALARAIVADSGTGTFAFDAPALQRAFDAERGLAHP